MSWLLKYLAVTGEFMHEPEVLPWKSPSV